MGDVEKIMETVSEISEGEEATEEEIPGIGNLSQPSANAARRHMMC